MKNKKVVWFLNFYITEVAYFEATWTGPLKDYIVQTQNLNLATPLLGLCEISLQSDDSFRNGRIISKFFSKSPTVRCHLVKCALHMHACV